MLTNEQPLPCVPMGLVVKGSVEERIMEMVQQRKQGPGGHSHSPGPSSSRGFTWADLGAMYHVDNARVSGLLILCNGQQVAASAQTVCGIAFVRIFSARVWQLLDAIKS